LLKGVLYITIILPDGPAIKCLPVAQRLMAGSGPVTSYKQVLANVHRVLQKTCPTGVSQAGKTTCPASGGKQLPHIVCVMPNFI